MKDRSRPIVLGAIVTLTVSLIGTALSAGQGQPGEKAPMAEDVFTNVRVLKGIPVDEFGLMVFLASSGCRVKTVTARRTDVGKRARREPEKSDGPPDDPDDDLDQPGELWTHGGDPLHLPSRRARPMVTPSLAALGATLLDDADDVIPSAKAVRRSGARQYPGDRRSATAGRADECRARGPAQATALGTRPIDIFAKRRISGR
jgi:hypothetical protein